MVYYIVFFSCWKIASFNATYGVDKFLKFAITLEKGQQVLEQWNLHNENKFKKPKLNAYTFFVSQESFNNNRRFFNDEEVNLIWIQHSAMILTIFLSIIMFLTLLLVFIFGNQNNWEYEVNILGNSDWSKSKRESSVFSYSITKNWKLFGYIYDNLWNSSLFDSII